MTPKRRGWPAPVAVLLYIVLTMTVLWPIFSVPIPGLGDYLNHLARIHILATLDRSPDLQKFYDMHWGFAPYLGMDVIVTWLTRWIPLYQAGRLFAAVCVLMPVICAMALRAAVSKRVGLMPACAFLLSYNYLLSWGFLDYLFSAGLALLLFAGWIATAHWPRWPRVALFAAGLLLVYFSHVIACAAYCVMVAGFEIARAARMGFRPPGRVALNWLAAAVQSLPTLGFAAGFSIGEASPGAMVIRYGDVGTKLRAALSPVLFPGAETATLATVLACVAIGALLLQRGRLRLTPDIWPAAAAMSVAAVCVPSVLLGLWGYDFRLPLLAAILLVGAVSIDHPITRFHRTCLLTGLVLLTVFKSVEAHDSLRAIDGQIAEVRQVLTTLPRGQRLLVIEIDDPAAPARVLPYAMTIHMPMAAVIDRDAFVPNLFTGLNMVHFREALTLSSSPNAPPIGLAQLQEGLARTDKTAGPQFFNYGARVYWYGWPEKFDFVLILHFGDPVPDLPPILHRVAASAIADLYKIQPR